MGWFNYYGLAVMAIIMIPNIIYAVKHRGDAAYTYPNKSIVVVEQIGRYGCFVFMIFNIPYTYFNFWFDNALTVYLSVNGGLCLAYIFFWIICWGKNDRLRALSLSILPTCIFLFSGITLANIPLIVCAILFGATHILISYDSAVTVRRGRKRTVHDKIRDEVLLILVILIAVLAVVGAIFGGESARGAFPLDTVVSVTGSM